mmetsp:Transcript_18556/g.34553  ORF Transcript_18556/g.34553 Transcript_18556/m.34553 type:complete len:126 (+) Transcript_18556:2026-2403(+)
MYRMNRLLFQKEIIKLSTNFGSSRCLFFTYIFYTQSLDPSETTIFTVVKIRLEQPGKKKQSTISKWLASTEMNTTAMRSIHVVTTAYTKCNEHITVRNSQNLDTVIRNSWNRLLFWMHPRDNNLT